MKYFLLNLLLSKRDKALLKAILMNKLSYYGDKDIKFDWDEFMCKKSNKSKNYYEISRNYMTTLVELGKLEKAIKP